MYKVYFNGYFTKEHINGVPRYATEIIKRLDLLIEPGVGVLVVPKGANNIPELTNIHISTWEERGKRREIDNVLWGELTYGNIVEKGALNINFSNRAERIANSITMIHDVLSLKDYKYGFKLHFADRLKIVLYDLINLLWLKHRLEIKKQYSKLIVTVSEYSCGEIERELGIPREKIRIIGNGWEHIRGIVSEDEKADERIIRGQYYFTIANLKPHKNIKWLIREAELMPNQIFVIAGKIPQYIRTDLETRGNVVFLGYVSDSYMKFLMENAKALLFPSLEEGFGIPPLEALALGTPAIVSDIPVMHEIFADSVGYFHPEKEYDNLDEFVKFIPGVVENVLKQHSWDHASKEWLALISDAI